ncbi:Ankyrin-3 [Cladobotryum mycophilum]|uniref:Ankyrin-3 n=1 Tax=Cladobotryum mycophilum TaxID=491253 RepID=A0ABR0SSV2_9HYPO
MPLFPFRSSSVKAKSSGGGGGGLFSKKNNRQDGPKRNSASTSDDRRRRRSSPNRDVLLPPEPHGPLVSTRDSRSRDPVPRPPPTRRGRGSPKRRSTYRSSRSPPPHRDSSRDGHHDRRPESPTRRRYSSSEIPRPQLSSPTPGSPSHLRPPTHDSPNRRDRPGYHPAPVASAPSIHQQSNYAHPSSHPTSPPKYPASAHYRPQAASAINSPRPKPSAPAHPYRPHSSEGHGARPQHGPAKPAGTSIPHPTHSAGEVDGVEGFFKRFPTSFATYTAVKELSKHADRAKEWAEWFNHVNGAPDEIRLLSSKVKIAKDTVLQIQSSLEARPDLIEDETGQNLKVQIDEVIDNTSETLKRMTKLLSSFTAAVQQDGTALGRLEGFWHSYNYKNEGEGQIRATDAELQIHLTELTTLMSNIYARALRSPGPSSPRVTTPNATTPTQSTTAPRPQEPAGSVNAPDTSSRPAPETPKPAEATKPPTNETAPQPSFNLPRKPPRDTNSYPSSSPPSAQPTGTPLTPNVSSNHAAPHINIDPKPDPKDILLDATWEGDLTAVSEALRNASPNTCDPRNLTPLHLAAERDHMAVAMLLLDRGANIHARADGGCMPLHLAARYASADTVEMLIDRAGADPNARTSDGRTPLHYAARSAEDGGDERREVIRTLRDFGADPTLTTRKGETPRDVAQKRDNWDAAATLRRAEKKWEEEHIEHEPEQNWFQRHGLMK